jgi:hypothetical protein
MNSSNTATHSKRNNLTLPRKSSSSIISTRTSKTNTDLNNKHKKHAGTTDIIKKLHSCAKKGKAQEAEQCLKQMQTMFDQGNKDMRPDFRHYNSMMHAWVKSNCSNKEFYAQSILEWMCELQKKSPNGEDYTHLKPTNVSFNICINAWSKSKEIHSPDVAWYLFELMQSMKEEGHLSCGSDYHTCRVIIHALSKRVEEGTIRKAERVLQIMHDSSDCKPDASIYNQILHIHSFNKEKDAPQKGEKMMNDMHARYLAGDDSLKPTTLTFNTLLNTYAKSNIDGAAERAEMILQHMQELFESGHDFAKPDVISFNTVINAHACSQKVGADRRAYDILQKMKELNAVGRIQAVPNVRTYNACMKACLCSSSDMNGNISEKEQSMALACSLLAEMNERNVSSDEHTYSWFFRACQYLCIDDLSRYSRVQWAYGLCRINGILNDRIERQVHQITRTIKLDHPHPVTLPPSSRRLHSIESDNLSDSGYAKTDNYPLNFTPIQAIDQMSVGTSAHSQSSRQQQPLKCISTSNSSILSSSLCSRDDSTDYRIFEKASPSSQISQSSSRAFPSIVSLDGSLNMWAYEPGYRKDVDTITEAKRWVSEDKRSW